MQFGPRAFLVIPPVLQAWGTWGARREQMELNDSWAPSRCPQAGRRRSAGMSGGAVIGWRCCPSVRLVSRVPTGGSAVVSAAPPFPRLGSPLFAYDHAGHMPGRVGPVLSLWEKTCAWFPRHFLVGSGLGSFNTTCRPFQFHYG